MLNNENWPQKHKIIENIIKERKGLDDSEHISAAKIAQFLGIKQKRVEMWRKGQLATTMDIAHICRYAGISPAWLLLDEGHPKNEDNVPKDSEDIELTKLQIKKQIKELDIEAKRQDMLIINALLEISQSHDSHRILDTLQKFSGQGPQDQSDIQPQGQEELPKQDGNG